MFVLSSLRPDEVGSFAIPVSLLLGGSFAVGLLVGARLGLAAGRRCYLYAAGFSLRLLGILDIGAVVSLLCLAVLNSPAFDSLLAHVVVFMGASGQGLDDDVRLMLLFLPPVLFSVGHLACVLAARSRAGAPDKETSRQRPGG